MKTERAAALRRAGRGKVISRRGFLRVSAGTTVVAGLAACAPAAAPSSTGAPAEAPAAPEQEMHDLIYWNDLTGPDGEIQQALVDSYNEGPGKEAGVQITFEIYPGDTLFTKNMAAYAAGNPIDILRASAPQTNLMVGNQMLVPLDDVMTEAGLDWGDFYPSPLEAFTIDGSRYSIPQEVSNYTIFFNTDQAEAAGLDVENFPSDRDEFIDWVQAVTERDGDQYDVVGLVIPGSGGLPFRWWFQLVYQFGGSLLTEDYSQASFNNDAGGSACQFILDCFDTYKISSRDILDARRAFMSLYGSIIQDGAWMSPAFAEQEGLSFDTALVPVVGNELFSYAITMAGVIIRHDPEETGRVDACAHFLKWMSDDPTWNIEVPTVPVRQSIGEMEELQAIPYMKPFIDLVPYGIEAPPIAEFGEIRGRIVEILDSVWATDLSVTDGLARAEEQVNDILAG